MRHRLAALAVAALTVAATVAAGSPAWASTRTFPDTAGDAPAFLDVTGLKVFDGRTEVAVKAEVPGFDPAQVDRFETGDAFTSLILRFTVRGAKRTHVDAVLDRSTPHGPIDRVELFRDITNLFSGIRCTGATSTVAKGSLKVEIPRSCFGRTTGRGAGDVRVKAILQGNVGPQGYWDGTYTTPWVRRG